MGFPRLGLRVGGLLCLFDQKGKRRAAKASGTGDNFYLSWPQRYQFAVGIYRSHSVIAKL